MKMRHRNEKITVLYFVSEAGWSRQPSVACQEPALVLEPARIFLECRRNDHLALANDLVGVAMMDLSGVSSAMPVIDCPGAVVPDIDLTQNLIRFALIIGVTREIGAGARRLLKKNMWKRPPQYHIPPSNSPLPPGPRHRL